jgi:RHS repeat-associated protein
MTVLASEDRDALVDLHPKDLPVLAFGVAKFTYVWTRRGAELTTSEALLRDRPGDGKHAVGPDLRFTKGATDVVVLGNAYPGPFHGQASRQVWVELGAQQKRLQVFAPRVLCRSAGQSRVETTGPLGVVPLTRAEAYGGGAALLPGGDRGKPLPFRGLVATAASTKGVYPRNPYGRGYWGVAFDEDVLLPCVEDPSDLLTLERVLGQHEVPWETLPLPWHLDWTSIDQFPRFPLAVPRDPRVPSSELKEVVRGFCPVEWADLPNVDGVEAYAHGAPMLQEASHGMVWRSAEAGAPVKLVGLHPEEDVLDFKVPAAPRMEIEIEGSRELVAPRLINFVITPHEKKFTMTWVGIRRDLPRKFIPGIHAHIPLRLYVDGRPIDYDTPTPIYQQLRRAEREGRIGPQQGPKPGQKGYLELSQGLLADEPAVRERDQGPRAIVDANGEIDVATGRVVFDEVDFVLDGGTFPFRVARSYSSSRCWRASALGPGWSHPLEQAVWTEEQSLFYRTEDGRELLVANLPSGELGLGQSVHYAPEGVTVARIAGDAYEVLRGDGWRAQLTLVPRSVQLGPVEARPVRLISPFGVSAEVGYDARGQLARLVLPSRREIRFEHDARGRLIAVHVPTAGGSQHALAARYEHDGAGQLAQATEGNGHTTRYRYECRLLVERSAHGLITRYRYDGDGAHARAVACEIAGSQEKRRVLWSAKARNAVAIDAVGNARFVQVDGAYRPTLARDAFGKEAKREYDEASGVCIAAADRTGLRTEFLYDAAGHLAEEARSDGSRVLLDYDELGHLLTRTNPEGSTERWGWDRFGRLQAHTSLDAATTVYDYDAEGRLAAVIAPGEVRLALEHDADGTTVRTPTGGRRISLDALGRISAVTDEEGHTIELRRDPSGRPRSLEVGDLVVSVERGAGGAVTRYRDGVTDVALDRDAHGRLSAARARDDELVVLHRDADGRVTLVQDPALHMHELRYDERGCLREESARDDAVTRYRYDAEERLVSVQRPGGIVSHYDRDRLGRVVRARHGALEEQFERTPAGHVKSAITSATQVYFERDGAGRILRETSVVGGRAIDVVSRYDTAGRRVGWESNLGAHVRVDRDSMGAPRAFVVGNHWTIELANDACGRERERKLPGGLVLRSDRDALGRLERRRILFGAAVLAETTYRWAGLDRLTGSVSSREGQTVHVHDARGNLAAVRRGMGTLVRAVDEVGNIYRVDAKDDHRYSPTGRLLDAYGVEYRYDDAGRRVEKHAGDGSLTRYRWEGPSRLCEVELPEGRRVRYCYDGLGRCLLRTVERADGERWIEERVRRYVWDGLSLLHEIEGDDMTSWLWLDGALVGTVQQGRWYGVLTDAIGVVREVVDERGGLAWNGGIDAFGVGWRDVEQVRQPWRWRGYYEDEETGLAMSLLRAYDPEAAQHLSPAPLGISSGTSTYGYLADPLSSASPLGLGPGPDRWIAREIPLSGEQLHVELLLSSLDRKDGAAGHAARPMFPDAHELMWGPWARFTALEDRS